MAAELQSLLEKIQSEGVDKAQAKAASILAEAEKAAAAKIAEAEKAAEAHLAKAEADAAVLRERSVQAVRQAARDVVLDVGCLHSLGKARHAAYKARLLQWLAPGGDFILVHCGRRGWWDRWPIGPDRAYHTDIERLFAPELELRAYRPELLTGMPLFMGRSALAGRYWLRRVR